MLTFIDDAITIFLTVRGLPLWIPEDDNLGRKNKFIIFRGVSFSSSDQAKRNVHNVISQAQ